MEENRKLVRQQRLQKFGRILANRYRLNVHLKNGGPVTACTNSTNMIMVKADINKDEFINLLIQKAMILHEIGHVLYTSNKLWKMSTVDKNLLNIIEDGRVEESISRKFSKARLYFIFANQKLLQYKHQEPLKLSNLTMELIFREAKKTTGVPQLPPEIHTYLKENLGTDYKWFLRKTRQAVETESKQELLALVLQMDNKLNKKFPKEHYYSKFPKVSNTPATSIDNCGSTSLNVPDLSEQDKKLIKQIVKQLKKQAAKKEESEDTDKQDGDGKGEGEGKGESIEEKKDIEGKGTEKTEEPKDKEQEETKEKTDDNIISSIENQLQDESMDEVRQETEILSTGVVDRDFSQYGDETTAWWERPDKPISTVTLEPIANRIAHLFKTISQSGDGWNHNQTRGKLEMHKITSLLSSNEQPRVFKRKEDKKHVDLSVVILLDGSGSMSFLKHKATKAAYIMARALELGKYKSEVIQFFGHGDNFIGLKSFNQKLDYAKHEFKPMNNGGTPLLHALKGAEKSLNRIESNRKIILVVTDGRPMELGLCRRKIREIEKKGIIVMGILINYRDFSKLFNPKHKLNCDEVEQLPPKMTGIIKNVLMSR